MKREKIKDGVFITFLPNEKFKRNRISISFILPNEKEKATMYAVLPTLMERGYEDYPDMCMFSKKLNQRRVFEIENCLEELSIRILARLPDANIQIDLNYDDTLSAKLCYEGPQYNPLHIEKDEDELDIMGLKLVRHRALRAAYRYRNHTNHVHVVL